MSDRPPLDMNELRKVAYVDVDAIGGRVVKLMPLWDGARWRLWIAMPPRVIETAGSPVVADYVAREAVDPADAMLPFVDFMWQRASWAPICAHISGISADFHHLMASLAKVRHFHERREELGVHVATEFVVTEIEYICTVTRGIFDLLQEAIARLWRDFVRLRDAEAEAKRRGRQLPDTFSRLVLRDKRVLRTAEEIVGEFGLTPSLAKQYAALAPFFAHLRDTRDRIVHGLGTDPLILSTDKGFCVHRGLPPFSAFTGWTPAHVFRDEFVSLRPWLAHVVLHTVEACDALVVAFSREIEFPPPIAPGYHVFVRAACSAEISDLRRVRDGALTWWSD